MKDDNKIGDFFRKRFDDFSTEPSSWERPDAGVRKSILMKVNEPVKSVFPYGKVIGLLSFVLMIGLVGYCFWTYEQKVSDLEIALEDERIVKQGLDKELVELKNKFFGKQEKETLNQEKTKDIKEIHTTDENINLLNSLNGKEKTIISIEKERSKMNFKLNLDLFQHFDAKTDSVPLTKKNNSSPQIELNSIEVEKPDLDTILKPNISKSGPIEMVALIPNLLYRNYFNAKRGINPKLNQDLIIQKSTELIAKKKDFFVAYEFSFNNIDYSSKFEFENQFIRDPLSMGGMIDILDDGISIFNKKVSIPQHGLIATIFLNENLQFKTGARYGKQNINDFVELKEVIYNSQNEVEDGFVNRRNELLLNIQTLYNRDVITTMDLSFSAQERLEEGEVYSLTLNQSEDFTFIQVPLSIGYRKEIGRLGLDLDLGGTWNSLISKNYNLSTTMASAEGINLSAVAREQVYPISQIRYLGASGALGVNYRLSNKWQLRCAYTSNYYFNKLLFPFKSSSRFGNLYSLGLNYQL